MWSPAEASGRVPTPAALSDWLGTALPRPSRYLLAYSGGLDSSVLLHLLARVRDSLPAPLSAMHVEHGLQPASAAWAQHCEATCAALGVPFAVASVQAAAQPGESREAAAREARYAALGAALGAGGMLLTAQHLDDQVETFLLQLLRGAGLEGLSGMPVVRSWQDGWQVRPLLGCRRATLAGWAREQGLHWIEDPSNADQSLDRNYLRRGVLPLIEARWPGAAGAIARSAGHCAEAAALVASLAQQDLAAAAVEEGERLALDFLRQLPSQRASQLLRHWLRSRGAPALPARRLREALRQLCAARGDAAPCIRWAGWALRRYRDQVWLVQEQPGPLQPFKWDGATCDLEGGLGTLERRMAPGGIDPAHWRSGSVEVRSRWSGMRCRPAGRAGHRDFKHLAQDCGIPPWLRDQVPVVVIDGRPAAVAGCYVCAPFAAAPGQSGWWVDWRPRGTLPLSRLP